MMHKQSSIRTNVDVGLVTREGSVVAHTIHPPAGALEAKSILDWVDTAIVLSSRARSALEYP